MRKLTLALLVAAAALAAGSCSDYFRGMTLVFEFEKLPVLHRLPALPDPLPDGTAPEDYAYAEGTNDAGAKCADDDYVAVARHQEMVDDIDVPYQQSLEYHVWATINGGPVRIARFVTRDCTTSAVDKIVKPAITTVSYTRLPDAEYGYPKKPSEWYGIVNQVVSSVPSGGATILTDVRLDDATEVFITREESATVTETSGPMGTLLMQGAVEKSSLVYKVTLKKVSGSASGLLTAIPADRVSAW
jgi:hypothetical protein